MGYLYYCGKCNSLISDKYEDDLISCENCLSAMTPLHIDELEWGEMEDEDKKSLLDQYRTPQIQSKKKEKNQQPSKEKPSKKTVDTIKVESKHTSKPLIQSEPIRDSQTTGRVSGLSVTGFIFSFLGCISFIGLILGIIDVTKKDGRKKGLSIAAIIISSVIMIIAIGVASSRSGNKETATSSNDNNTDYVVEESHPVEDSAVEEAVTEEPEEVMTDSDETAVSTYNIDVASNSSDMHLGDIAERNGIYFSLNYVKRMDYLPLSLNQTAEVDPSHEVIIPFFELFNGGAEKQNFSDDRFTCYVDGTQVNKVDASLLTDIDDIHGINGSYEIEPGTKAFLAKNFEVPRDWSEIKIFYDDGCTWTISSSEVGTESFAKQTLFDVDITREVTPEGAVIYDDDYQITYKGFEEYTKDSLWGPEDYAIIKLTIENTGSQPLDYNLVGFNMRGYCNDYLTEDPDFLLDEKFDSFINIHDVDSIQSGMATDVYVAFKVREPIKNFYFVYDVGYIVDNALGSVYIEK